MTKRDQVLQKVNNCLGPHATDRYSSGCVLYNGWRTLSPGRVYVMGLNPGGEPGEGESIIESLYDQKLDDEAYSSYDSQQDPWEWRGKTEKGRDHPHQRRVRELVARLGILKICDVFATNAIFTRSVGQTSLDRPHDMWKKCWPVHQLFLSIVQPKVILCLGNGGNTSAYAFVKDIATTDDVCLGQGRGKVVKYFIASINLGDHGILAQCAVIGVPHPSWYSPSGYAKEFMEAHMRCGLDEENTLSSGSLLPETSL